MKKKFDEKKENAINVESMNYIFNRCTTLISLDNSFINPPLFLSIILQQKYYFNPSKDFIFIGKSI